MVTRRDYTAEAVEAAKRVLIELVHLIGEYRNDVVVVGGWVPELLLENPAAPHTGSMDIDLALDHRRLREEGYRTIRDLLLGRGFREGPQPSVFLRDVLAGDASIVVEVHFLSGEYGGTGRGRRHQRMPGIQARKARGCDLAFTAPKEMRIEGELPGGRKDSVVVRVASIVPFLVMKGMALADRLKEKDPWDIYYCVKKGGFFVGTHLNGSAPCWNGYADCPRVRVLQGRSSTKVDHHGYFGIGPHLAAPGRLLSGRPVDVTGPGTMINGRPRIA